MPEQPSLRVRVAKGAALLCSVSLGLLVIVNAQFGCDAPTATAPEDSTPAKAEPTAKAGDPPTQPAQPAQPAVTEPVPTPEPSPQAEPEVDAQANVEAVPEQPERPIMMPASKSGGDFGAMRFPGQAPSQQQQQQAPNPAPNAAKKPSK